MTYKYAVLDAFFVPFDSVMNTLISCANKLKLKGNVKRNGLTITVDVIGPKKMIDTYANICENIFKAGK